MALGSCDSCDTTGTCYNAKFCSDSHGGSITTDPCISDPSAPSCRAASCWASGNQCYDQSTSSCIDCNLIQGGYDCSLPQNAQIPTCAAVLPVGLKGPDNTNNNAGDGNGFLPLGSVPAGNNYVIAGLAVLIVFFLIK